MEGREGLDNNSAQPRLNSIKLEIKGIAAQSRMRRRAPISILM